MTIEEAPLTRRNALDVRSAFREIIETILLTLIIFLVVRGLVQPYRVEGTSMEPNLHSGQFLLVNKAIYFHLDPTTLNRLLPFLQWPADQPFYLFQRPERGDVVVFRYPKEPSRDFVKRVIAVPGETVEVRNGVVFVNGQRLDEPYLRDRASYNFGPEKVPANNFFVLGDNRDNSSDSHVWGMVPSDMIIGKAWISYWPVSSWGLAPNYRVTAGS
ncbi:MAG: signal peptidase I [Dehalococcoidia bacterium]|nr:MAG: signal peptidase I [Dehalococcoidia bacterium]